MSVDLSYLRRFLGAADRRVPFRGDGAPRRRSCPASRQHRAMGREWSWTGPTGGRGRRRLTGGLGERHGRMQCPAWRRGGKRRP